VDPTERNGTGRDGQKRHVFDTPKTKGEKISPHVVADRSALIILFGRLAAVAGFVPREEYCWLVAGGWFVLREKYC
jgi:hypothetical protein